MKGGEIKMNDKIKLILFGAIIALVGILVFWFFTDKAGATFELPPFSKTICHHTPSNQVTHTFNTLGGYLGHLGTPHSGQTYDTNGACVEVTPTPTPIDYCDTLEGVQAEDADCPKEEEECPEGTHETPYEVKQDQVWEEEELVCIPDVTPTPEPSNPGGPGDDLSDSKGYSPAVCNGVFPDKPVIIEANYVKTGPTSAHFEFWGVKSDRYIVEYGYSKDNLPYGIEGGLPGDSEVKVRGFDLNDLQPGFNSLFARVTAKLGECYNSSEVAN